MFLTNPETASPLPTQVFHLADGEGIVLTIWRYLTNGKVANHAHLSDCLHGNDSPLLDIDLLKHLKLGPIFNSLVLGGLYGLREIIIL